MVDQLPQGSDGGGGDGRSGAHDRGPNREGEAIATDPGEQFGHCRKRAQEIQRHGGLHRPYGQGRRHSLAMERQWH